MAARKKTLQSGELVLAVYTRLYAIDGNWRAFEKAFPNHSPDERLRQHALVARGRYLQEER